MSKWEQQLAWNVRAQVCAFSLTIEANREVEERRFAVVGFSAHS